MEVVRLSPEILKTTVLACENTNRFPILKPKRKEVLWVGLNQEMLHKDMIPFIKLMASSIGFAGGLKRIEKEVNSILLEGGGTSLSGYYMVWDEFLKTQEMLNGMLNELGNGGKVIVSK